MDGEPYSVMTDSYGASASVYFGSEDRHVVTFSDSDGRAFYTEVFDQCPIEHVSQYAFDWAKGNRVIEGI